MPGPSEYEHSISKKIEALQIGLKTQNISFCENGYNDFDSISVIHGDHIRE
jgi:hypothetical protein